MDAPTVAVLRDHAFRQNAAPFVERLSVEDPAQKGDLLEGLDGPPGLPWELHANGSAPVHTPTEAAVVGGLAQNGFLEFWSDPEAPALVLTPASPYFDAVAPVDVSAETWTLSRFGYLHPYDGRLVFRNPKALCALEVRDPAVLELYAQFETPTRARDLRTPPALDGQLHAVLAFLARAQIIVPCDDDGAPEEARDPSQRQWDFHDLLFHSSSRLGRNGKPIGGTFRFKGELDPLPPAKDHTWTDVVIPLAVPDLHTLFYTDMPLTAAIETRTARRQYSPLPLTIQQVGEFLYRTVRNRRYYSGGELGEFTSRPYPNGGAIYESEFYLTIDACLGIAPGFYYYDPRHHALCLVQPPSADTKAMLDTAEIATAGTGRPQILVTIASRHNRFNWKYVGMSYATQLKDVGAIYQTMWLVATAMNIGACGLGIGDTDRFLRLTGLDYFEEGSVGEVMLGRPL